MVKKSKKPKLRDRIRRAMEELRGAQERPKPARRAPNFLDHLEEEPVIEI